MRAVFAFLMALVAGLALADTPSPLTELRYCGPPARNADGSIKRSSAVLRAFQKIHPCPSTLLRTGACPGWAKNHSLPLACGGCDAVWNLVWMRGDAKEITDSYEREITTPVPGINPEACHLELQQAAQ
jgi:hypothetical protein